MAEKRKTIVVEQIGSPIRRPSVQRATLIGLCEQELRSNANIQNARSDLEMNKPELRIAVNRDKAATFGVDVTTIGSTLSSPIVDPTTSTRTRRRSVTSGRRL